MGDGPVLRGRWGRGLLHRMGIRANWYDTHSALPLGVFRGLFDDPALSPPRYYVAHNGAYDRTAKRRPENKRNAAKQIGGTFKNRDAVCPWPVEHQLSFLMLTISTVAGGHKSPVWYIAPVWYI
jgi:hypothetical protein